MSYSDKFLNASIQIAEQLLSQSELEGDCRSWLNMTSGQDLSILYNKKDDLYSGNAGIALFFAELYQQTKTEKYLIAAQETFRWVLKYCDENPSPYFALITGRLGICNALFRLAEIDKDPLWKEVSLKLAQRSISFLNTPNAADDIINGFAGTAIGLARLYQLSKADFLLDYLQQFVLRLIENAWLSPKGLYWDRSSLSSKGLCGFSHGAAGFSWLFSELYALSNQIIFKELAIAALSYENQYFNAEHANWPDFRKGIFKATDYEEHLVEFKNKRHDFFTDVSFMSAWCHGAMGIGLSRLDVIKNLSMPVLQNDIDAAIETVKRRDVDSPHYLGSYTLCHGFGGNADLLIEAYLEYKDEAYLESAYAIGEKHLKAFKELGYHPPGLSFAPKGEEDSSLFMGNAGVGYFLLRLASPSTVPSVLRPNLDKDDCLKDVNFSAGQSLYLIPFKKFFPKTIAYLQYCKADLSTIKTFDSVKGIEQIQEIISGLALSHQERALDIFKIEKICLYKDTAQKGFNLSAIKLSSIEKHLSDHAEYYLSAPLVLNSDLDIQSNSWNWLSLEFEEIQRQEADELYCLIRPHHIYTSWLELSDFSLAVLLAFEEENNLEAAKKSLCAQFEISNAEEKQAVETAVIDQVKQAFLSGLLIPSSLNISTLQSVS